MAKRAERTNKRNHSRQLEYLRKGIVMLPTLKEERKKPRRK